MNHTSDEKLDLEKKASSIIRGLVNQQDIILQKVSCYSDFGQPMNFYAKVFQKYLETENMWDDALKEQGKKCVYGLNNYEEIYSNIAKDVIKLFGEFKANFYELYKIGGLKGYSALASVFYTLWGGYLRDNSEKWEKRMKENKVNESSIFFEKEGEIDEE